MPTFHTKRSPSQAKRFLSCAGALALCDSLPENQRNQTTVAALLGTAAHAIIERCLREGSHPEDYRDRIVLIVGDGDEGVSILRPNAKTPRADEKFFIVDSDIIDGAEMMTTYVRQRCKELGVKESELQLETRTNPLPERDDTSGTADVTIDAFPVLLEVVDYKNGYNVVEHEDNEQLLAYLLGKALEDDFAHEEYKITVVQPNAPHEEGRIRSFSATKEELLAFQKRYRAGIEKCEKAETEFEAATGKKGDVNKLTEWEEKWLKAGDHCLFCDAQAVCPARRKLAEDQAQIDFADEPRELQFKQREADVARILAWADQMDALIRAATNYAIRSLQSGHKVPGFKLVRGKSNRKWVDRPADKIVETLIGEGFFKNSEREKLFTKPELLSGPQVEKLLPPKKRKDFSEIFLVKPEGGLTLARADDPRAEVNCDPGEDFADDDFG